LRISCPGDAAAFARLEAALRAVLAPQALLFDMDGVLADVSRSYRRAILETAASFGVALSPDDVARAKARGDANDDWALTRRLLAERGCERTLAEVTAVFERLYQGADGAPGLRASERPIPSRELLERLGRRAALGVVTGRPRRDAQAFLESAGLVDCFATVVAREDAPLKPDPAPVRLALERLDVRAAWMVGDTPDDVRAARAAGAVPLGFVPPDAGGDSTRGALSCAGAARVLATLEELDEVYP